MSRRGLTSIVFGTAALLLGCKADSGIIVAVSGAGVEELEFQVALSRDDQFVIDPTISGERRPMQGRDLTSNPYELLLREDQSDQQAAPATVRVLALGYRAGEISAFALMEPAQAFVRGELLRRNLTLQELSNSATATAVGKGCYSVQASDKSYLLVVGGDRDCDGFGPEDGDCNDADATVKPGAKEVCDGKDNNCDGQYAPPTEICYQDDLAGVCRQGTRACSEGPNGGGLAADCVVSSTSVESNALGCLVYSGCSTQSAPLLCFQNHLVSIDYSCTLEYVEGSGTCGWTRDLPAPFSGDGCHWNLASSGDWPITLEAVPSSCNTKVVVASGAPNGTGPVALEFVDEVNKRGAFITLEIQPKVVATCSSQPLVCTKQ